MTSDNKPGLQDPDAKLNPSMFRLDLLSRTTSCGTPTSRSQWVIANTLEAATEGAALLSPRYGD